MDHFPEGYFYIQSRASGKVVDVDGASLKDDATILLWTPKHNSDDRDNQLFYYQDGFLINKHSQKVLDVRGGPITEGARVIQYSRKLVADAQNQQWGYNNKEGYIYVLADPRFVLDVRSLMDGARLIISHKKYALDPSNQNQLWDLIPAGDVRAEREVLFETDFV
ncbi:ricin B lectin domain-containing protein [Halteromyces radiatus]|uniref:ricin B lectin domain-containing protein n=1 Tax=Halteromyces radiatus TaxID=101107 RepID=UPI0022206418|nr:ricin B lectin domain-containing protein [Halteromyces radiatus]KAI8089440.1 ricin B lectin domain-containing protein [Halteromyces radiatus]